MKVVPEYSEFLGLKFIRSEITKGTSVTAEFLLEVEVRFQGKRLLGGEKGK